MDVVLDITKYQAFYGSLILVGVAMIVAVASQIRAGWIRRHRRPSEAEKKSEAA